MATNEARNKNCKWLGIVNFGRGTRTRAHSRVRDRARNPFEPRMTNPVRRLKGTGGKRGQTGCYCLCLDKLVTGPGCVRCQGRVLRLSEITIRHTGCVFAPSVLFYYRLHLYLFSHFSFYPTFPSPYLFLPPSQLTLGENKKQSSRRNIRPRSA